MPVVQISPKQLFTKNTTFLSAFSSAGGLFVLATILLIVFVANIRKQTVTITPSQTIYTYPSPWLLYSDLLFISIALILAISCLVMYYRIFHFSNSSTLVYVLLLLIVILVVFSVSVYYSVIKKNYCPEGKIFDQVYKQCVPICPPGKLLDGRTLTCVDGCTGSGQSNCEKGFSCVNDSCCRNELIASGQCCGSVDSIKIDGSGNKVCCSGNMCGGVCCLEPDAKCMDISGGSYCAVKCDNTYCSKGEACLQFEDMINGTKSIVRKCVDPNGECNTTSPGRDNKYYPSSVGDSSFYSAFSSSDLKEFKSYLGCNPWENTSQDCKDWNDIWTKDNTKYFCGASDPVRFKSMTLQGKNCTERDVINQLVPGEVIRANWMEDKTVEKKDGTKTWVLNQVLSPQMTGPKTYKLSTLQNDGRVITTEYPFKGKSTNNGLNALESSCNTKGYNTFQNKCDVFSECKDGKCPFIDTGNKYTCPQNKNNGVGLINEAIRTKWYCNDMFNPDNPCIEIPVEDNRKGYQSEDECKNNCKYCDPNNTVKKPDGTYDHDGKGYCHCKERGIGGARCELDNVVYWSDVTQLGIPAGYKNAGTCLKSSKTIEDPTKDPTNVDATILGEGKAVGDYVRYNDIVYFKTKNGDLVCIDENKGHESCNSGDAGDWSHFVINNCGGEGCRQPKTGPLTYGDVVHLQSTTNQQQIHFTQDPGTCHNSAYKYHIIDQKRGQYGPLPIWPYVGPAT